MACVVEQDDALPTCDSNDPHGVDDPCALEAANYGETVGSSKYGSAHGPALQIKPQGKHPPLLDEVDPDPFYDDELDRERY